MGARQSIDVDLLVVDEENPRFEAVSSESDALFSILDDQSLASGNKILNLARSIAENGLNASELLVVSPIEGGETYRVREGNRRVTAIKLSLYPDRVPDDFKSLKPQFIALTEPMQQRRTIDCYVTSDETEIRTILTLRHAGESGDIGVVRWDAVQKARFAQGGNQQSERAISLIDSIRTLLGDGEMFFTIAGIPATNIGRLISTPEVRQALNITVEGSEARYLGGHDDLLLDVLKTVKRDGVVPIYHKESRIHLIEDARRRIEPSGITQTQIPLPEPEEEAGTASSPYDSSPRNQEFEERAIDSHPPEIDNDYQGDEQVSAHVPDGMAGGAKASSELALQQITGPDSDKQTKGISTPKRKPVSRSRDTCMFGCVLRPAGTKSNDLYRAIDWIDQQYLGNPDAYNHLLPILGFSLRLLVETVAREYYQSQGKEAGQNAFNSFMKDVAKPAIKKKLDSSGRDYMALASEWIDGDVPFDALFHKWAHGVLPVDRPSLVRQSELVALIINEVWSDGGVQQ